MPIDSAEPNCDQALNHLKLEDFSGSRDPDTNLKTGRQVEKKGPSLYRPSSAAWGEGLTSTI